MCSIQSSPSEHVDPYRCYLHGPTPDGLDAQVNEAEFLVNSWEKTFEKFYPSDQISEVKAELEQLFKAYAVDIYPGHIHCAPSPTWRDESIIELGHSTCSRFVTRVHVFERSDAGKAGRYLGFAALRPHEAVRRMQQSPRPGVGYRYVIEGELVCPRHMKRPRYHLILTNATSARLGILPLRSAVFMAPRHDERNRSTCMHLALSQALHLVMGRFGSRPISQREFDIMLWNQLGGSVPLAAIAEQGAKLTEALEVVRNCDAGGFLASFFEEPSRGMKRKEVIEEAHRCLTDTLANGLPVIMMVDYAKLGQLKTKTDDQPLPHAVLIFGMHLLHSAHEAGRLQEGYDREDHAELPGRLIGADVLEGPFKEWSVRDVLDAAFSVKLRDMPYAGIHFLALGPRHMQIGLSEVREIAKGLMERLQEDNGWPLWSDYAMKHGWKGKGNCPKSHQWRYVTRLITKREIFVRFFPDRSVEDLPELQEALRPQANSTASEYYWSVEVRLPKVSSVLPINQRSDNQTLESVFDSPAAVFTWSITDQMRSGAELQPRFVRLWKPQGEFELRISSGSDAR